MSILENQTVYCPSCGKPMAFAAAHSVLADRRPDLRAAILADTFQTERCPHCEARFRRQPTLNYLDIGRGQWILAKPAAEVADWPSLEAQAQGIFELGYGSLAPVPAQEIGRGLAVRVVFGWPAFREKLLAVDAGLDDVALECLKLRLLRTLDGPALADTVEMRLREADDEMLTFAWLDADVEEVLEILRVPRALYDDMRASSDGYDGVRKALAQGPFVDMNRILVDPVDREVLPEAAEL